MPQSIHEILKQYWGYDEFRPLQEEIICSVLAGNDTLGLMPTGGGKSITFQVPAMLLEGICLVVTPLVALMKDQVDNLKQKGIKANYIHSGMSRREALIALDNCIYGGYKFLYVSPERLNTELFRAKLKIMQIALLVVDEAHCISQWGYDFRPSYMQIADIREDLPDIPVLALTATATPQVAEDIQEKLHFKRPNLFQKSFDRPNLSYIVRFGEDKIQQLTRILDRVPGTSIVYVRNRKKTKQIASDLQRSGYDADFFHAGLSSEIKNEKQQKWKTGACRIIVSTNAFGMGIDKPDVRTVIHLDLPDSPEEYYQEAGRAGRDGKRAYAVIIWSKADKSKLKKRISDTFPEKDFIRKVYDSLAYFLKIPEGEGAGTMFEFNLNRFCHTYGYPVLPTFNALKILEQAEYIVFTEEIDSLSRVMVTVNK
ncbi:MAG: ATP-dependent DNA helicase RecQ, partial [Coprobacter sp.]|nr:ATP-dependent DNA helicase RecQ [Coprobacter sp.]